MFACGVVNHLVGQRSITVGPLDFEGSSALVHFSRNLSLLRLKSLKPHLSFVPLAQAPPEIVIAIVGRRWRQFRSKRMGKGLLSKREKKSDF